MIYSDKHILYALELRMLVTSYAGSLCMVKGQIDKALRYFDIYPYKTYFTNPYKELPNDLILQMDEVTLKIFFNYNDLCNTSFTNDELRSIIKVCNKYSYIVTHHNHRISIRRSI